MLNAILLVGHVMMIKKLAVRHALQTFLNTLIRHVVYVSKMVYLKRMNKLALIVLLIVNHVMENHQIIVKYV